MSFYSFRISIIPSLLLATAAGMITWQIGSGLERRRTGELTAIVELARRELITPAEQAERVRALADVHRLARWLRYPASGVRRAAAQSLGVVGGPEMVPVLAPALRDRDRQTALLAQQAIRRVRARPDRRDVASLMARSEHSVLLGRHEDALRLLDRCVELLGGSSEQQVALAEIHFRRGGIRLLRLEFRRAAEEFERAVGYDALHFDAWAGLGHCARAVGLSWLAEQAYLQALAVNPNMDDVRRRVNLL